MKVTDKQHIGGTTAKVDGGKAGRTDSPGSIGKDLKSGGLSARDSVKDGSKVDVSQRAQMMAKAKGIASDNSIDEAKVARFQKLIDEGNYKVDSEKVADRLVD